MKKNLAVSLPYSRKLGSMESNVARYKREYLRIWGETSTDLPPLGKSYPEKRQKDIEKELFRFIDRASAKIDEYPDVEGEQKDWMGDFVADVRGFGRRFLEMSELSLETVLQEDFVRSTQMFVAKAKEFDPDFAIENVYQALRNAWIMNSLQMYLGLDVKFCDSLFAYSMIYPYMDNYLDDVSLSLEDKLRLTGKLRKWLEGEASPPQNRNEERILNLIKMIESEHDRKKFPGVYQSMLAIFNAQIKSLIQQKGHTFPLEVDILDCSFEKGGTSVLADGFLVSGTLTEKEADFCFGFGTYLQLADDIQDLVLDQRNKHATIFSLAAANGGLDNLASKLLNFIVKSVNAKLDENRKNEKALKELIWRNCALLILEAVGRNKDLYSRKYVRWMEPYFPIRFAKLLTLRKKIQRKFLRDRRNVIDLNLASAFLLTATSRIFSG
jgi:hypothetical protein